MEAQAVKTAQTGVKDFLTIGCAVLGATLGIINTFVGLNQRRVNLRVTPNLYVRFENGTYSTKKDLLPDGSLAIEVINLSGFPLTIVEAGFTLKGETRRMACGKNFTFDNKPWPRRLDSRESVTVYFPHETFPKNLNKAYVKTDCATMRYGDSPALKKFKAQLKEKTDG